VSGSERRPPAGALVVARDRLMTALVVEAARAASWARIRLGRLEHRLWTSADWRRWALDDAEDVEVVAGTVTVDETHPARRRIALDLWPLWPPHVPPEPAEVALVRQRRHREALSAWRQRHEGR
jgi:hypothetical protein